MFDISHGVKEAAGGDQEHGRRFKLTQSFKQDEVNPRNLRACRHSVFS